MSALEKRRNEVHIEADGSISDDGGVLGLTHTYLW